MRFEGEEGWVETGDSGRIEVYAGLASRRVDCHAAGGGLSAAQNVRNFLDCVKSGGLPAANSGVMRHSHIACHAAALAWQLGASCLRSRSKRPSSATTRPTTCAAAPPRAWHLYSFCCGKSPYVGFLACQACQASEPSVRRARPP